MKHGIHASLLPLACSISTLKADPKNARLHDERNIDAVEKSYDKHGQRKPIVVQKRRTPRMCEQCGGTGRLSVPMDGFNPSGSTPCLKCEGSGDLLEFIVRAGNGQMMAAKRLGWTHIAAVIVEENDKDAIAFAIRDNRTAELAEWDWKVIAEEMATFETGTGESFTELGWNEAELVPLRQTDWFLAATGQLEEHVRKPKDEPTPGSEKEEVTIVGKDAVSFIEAMTLMRERFGEPGMNAGHIIGRLARHYLATMTHSQSPNN